MVMDTWQPFGVELHASGDACPNELDSGDLSAQASKDGRTIVVRLLNAGTWARNYTLNVGSGNMTASSVTAQTISNANLSLTNTPSEPDAVIPAPQKQLSTKLPVVFELPAQSVTMIVVKL